MVGELTIPHGMYLIELRAVDNLVAVSNDTGARIECAPTTLRKLAPLGTEHVTAQRMHIPMELRAHIDAEFYLVPLTPVERRALYEYQKMIDAGDL